MTKKFLSVLLAIVMVIAIAPVSVFAEDNILDYLTYEIADGEVAITDCNESISGDVTIPDTIEGYPVTSIGVCAFEDCTSLTSITIPDSVTSIGERAFSWCESLTSITIPDSVASISSSAFYGTGYYNDESNWQDGVLYIDKHLIDANNDIIEFEIKEGTLTIGDGAFSSCTSLTSITVDADNENYSSDNGVLFNKDKTKLIRYPEGKTEASYVIPNSVTSIGYAAFSDCYSLESITIPDSVISIGDCAFMACISLKSIMIPDSVNIIGLIAFLNCEGLESITVDENNRYYSSDEYGVLFNKDKTELIWYPEANSKMSYKIPDSVITIADLYAFSYCYNLKSVTIGKNITTIGSSAFWYCTNLESVTIPDSVTTIDVGAFYECTSLTDVYYGGSEADWANISIGEYNEYLTSATIHYNYVIDEPETEEPTTDEPATDAPVTEENNSDNNDTSESSSSFFDRIIEFFMSFFKKIRQFFEALM